MDFSPIQSCLNCGYDLTGLPDGRPCPECGFDLEPAALQFRVEAWHGSWDGLLLRSPPPMALVLLDTPRCRRVALNRFITCLVAPILLAFVIITLLSWIRLTTIYDRWWESPDHPSVRRDLDQIRNTRLALSPRQTVPYRPRWTTGEKRYDFAAAERTPAIRIRVPEVNAFLPLATFLIVALSARIAAWPVFAWIADGYRQLESSNRRPPVWPALVWLNPPLWFGLLFVVAATAALAVADLLIDESLIQLGLILFALGLFVFAILGALKFVGAAHSLRPRQSAIEPFGLIVVWLICTAVIAVLAFIASLGMLYAMFGR